MDEIINLFDNLNINDKNIITNNINNKDNIDDLIKSFENIKISLNKETSTSKEIITVIEKIIDFFSILRKKKPCRIKFDNYFPKYIY